eukprot:TRINITY_DN58998_c0_g2_i1.p1 TRINITY_DN58998_c0_g2~~TRINITY_DN58998_c0_g2_i1.p1  ORF type:complete len:268 (+),score=64.14 TRINITY_DN58998_c0_g2_i1:74-877(+)
MAERHWNSAHDGSDSDGEHTAGDWDNPKGGLPLMSHAAKDKTWSRTYLNLAVMFVLPRLLGIIAAACVYQLTTPTEYDLFLKKLNAVSCQDEGVCLKDAMRFGLNYGYLYIMLAVFSMTVQFINLFPMLYKSQIMPGSAGNLRSNMAIFKVGTAGDEAELPPVVMMEQGDVGRYNRANRALFHFNENALPVLLNAFAAAFVFPQPMFMIAVFYCMARIWYQVAYTTGGYGIGVCMHGIPFAVQGILCAPLFEGFVWVIGIKMIQLEP